MKHALQVLEYGFILQRLQEHCETSLGASHALELQPSFEPDLVWLLMEETGEAHRAMADVAPPSLGAAIDWGLAARKAKKGALLGGEELYGIGNALQAMRSMRSYLQAKRAGYPKLWSCGERLPEVPRLEKSLLDSLEPNGDVKDGASHELAQLRRRKASASQRLLGKIQSYTTGRTRELLSDPIYTVRDGRYVVPLRAENRGKLRGIVHDTSASGQTIFVEPEDVLHLGNHLREIEAAERDEVARILLALSEQVGSEADAIGAGLAAAGELDLVFAKARLGYEMKGAAPERLKGPPRIEIAGGKHPLLDPSKAVPLDLAVGNGASVLITGPNTGGKTVAIKTVGVFVLMAQSGLMPPALSIRLSPFTQIWADIGDEQSLSQSLSTFSGHIKNIAEALRGLAPGALVLLDEVGAGTDPAEGAALARAILVEMSRVGATILASTHYAELKAFAYETDGFANAAMEFDTKTLQPTFRLRLGAPGASQALRIAERYGIPARVVEDAREGLTTQHRDIAAMMESLERAQNLARQAQAEADRRSAELKRAEDVATRKLAEANEIRATVHAKATQVIEDALREIRLEAAEVFEMLKQGGSTQEARNSLKALQIKGEKLAERYMPAETAPSLAVFRKGMSVRIDGMSQVGLLLEDPKEGEAIVQMGPMRMTIATSELRPAGASQREPVKARPNLRLQKAFAQQSELHLRHMRAEEAQETLEKFIDDSVLAGADSVRIVHGKGEGVLRKITQATLRKHSAIAEYRDAEPDEGGQGVTIAVFK